MLLDPADPAAPMTAVDDLSEEALAGAGISFPSIIKPLRGRGSQRVERVSTLRKAVDALRGYLAETEEVDGEEVRQYGALYTMEQYLAAEEVTVTVMPPGTYELDGRLQARPSHWVLPPVARTAHAGGIAPYNGVVAVTANSRVVPAPRRDGAAYAALAGACDAAAAAVGAIASIRIDARADAGGVCRLFDHDAHRDGRGSAAAG